MKYIDCYYHDDRWKCENRVSLQNSYRHAQELYGDIGFTNIELLKNPDEFDDVRIMLYRPRYFKAEPLDFLKEK